SGGKTDALDAVRAARSVLATERPSTPRAGGERQALQALVAAREGAVNAKRAGLCQLRDLLFTTPEPLRSELRPLPRARLLPRLPVTPRRDLPLSRLRQARRHRTDPRLARQDDPLPPRPIRRPQTHPRPPRDPPHTQALTPRHDRLHRTASAGRQDPPRSKPLP